MEKKNNRGEVSEEMSIRKKNKSYKKWDIISIFSVIIVVFVLGSIFVFAKYILDFIMIPLAILSIVLAIFAISQAMETREIIDTISFESTFINNPWTEATRLVESAGEGDRILVSAVAGWPTKFNTQKGEKTFLQVVDNYIKANIDALERGVYITRIFSFFNPKNELTQEIEDVAKKQETWKGDIVIRAYYDEKEEKKGSMDYCILERCSTPKSGYAVLWLHDPGHPNKILPGFKIENKRVLKPLRKDFKQKFDDSISLEKYFADTKNYRS